MRSFHSLLSNGMAKMWWNDIKIPCNRACIRTWKAPISFNSCISFYVWWLDVHEVLFCFSSLHSFEFHLHFVGCVFFSCLFQVFHMLLWVGRVQRNVFTKKDFGIWDKVCFFFFLKLCFKSTNYFSIQEGSFKKPLKE